MPFEIAKSRSSLGFCKSIDAPWENGCREALIKTVKSCLACVVWDAVMSFPELLTVLFEVAKCMNKRPIALNNVDPNEGTLICPNYLHLGRATTTVLTYADGQFKIALSVEGSTYSQLSIPYGRNGCVISFLIL